MHDPQGFDNFARKNGEGKTPDMVLGIKEGKSEVQAFRFPTSKFTEAEAKAFCDDKKGSFEPAAPVSEGEAMHSTLKNNLRYLSTKGFSPAKVTANADGSKTYHDVGILKAGKWRDSTTRQLVEYPAKILEEGYANWRRRTFNLDHNHLTLSTLGRIHNERYHDGGVYGDITVYALTQTQKEAMALMDAGLVDGISAEVATEDTFNPATNTIRAHKVTFNGAALTPSPACNICHLTEPDKIHSEEILNHFPHHDKENKVDRKNLISSTAAVLGARGTIIMDMVDRREVYAHLSNHFKQMSEEPPKFCSIVKVADGYFYDEQSGLNADCPRKLHRLLNEKFEEVIRMTEDIKIPPPVSDSQVRQLTEEKEKAMKELKEASVKIEAAAKSEADVKKLMEAKEEEFRKLKAELDDIKSQEVRRTLTESQTQTTSVPASQTDRKVIVNKHTGEVAYEA